MWWVGLKATFNRMAGARGLELGARVSSAVKNKAHSFLHKGVLTISWPRALMSGSIFTQLQKYCVCLHVWQTARAWATKLFHGTRKNECPSTLFVDLGRTCASHGPGTSGKGGRKHVLHMPLTRMWKMFQPLQGVRHMRRGTRGEPPPTSTGHLQRFFQGSHRIPMVHGCTLQTEEARTQPKQTGSLARDSHQTTVGAV